MRQRNHAKKAFTEKKIILADKKISAIKLRLRLLKCYVWSTLLYCCESWAISCCYDMHSRFECILMYQSSGVRIHAICSLACSNSGQLTSDLKELHNETWYQVLNWHIAHKHNACLRRIKELQLRRITLPIFQFHLRWYVQAIANSCKLGAFSTSI